MSNIIFFSNVRASFPQLVKPGQFKDPSTGATGKLQYKITLLFPENHPSFTTFLQKVGELALEKWKQNTSVVMNRIKNDPKSCCFGQGNQRINQKTFKVVEGYEGMMYLMANLNAENATGNSTRPQIIKADGTPVDPRNDIEYQHETSLIYPGCRVNAAVEPWMQSHQTYGTGIRCRLIAVQFAGDDTPFGESTPDVSNLFSGVQQSTTQNTAPAMGLPPFMMS